jgi:hypothetical protein
MECCLTRVLRRVYKDSGIPLTMEVLWQAFQ